MSQKDKKQNKKSEKTPGGNVCGACLGKGLPTIECPKCNTEKTYGKIKQEVLPNTHRNRIFMDY